jgi:Tfp pilus assembly protein PilE
MKNIFKRLKRVNGQSLAEFAVTTAMMATLATTAAPKFSGVGEGAKEKKTLADIDKILKAANNFYNEQVTQAGRGRFPGQSKYNTPVPSSDMEGVSGGYTYTEAQGQAHAENLVRLALDGTDGDDDAGTSAAEATFNNYASSDATNWASVFGTTTEGGKIPSGHSVNTAEDVRTGVDIDDPDYDIGQYVGAEEFLDTFGGDPINSPFQDGHYIYTVIAGGGTGTQSVAPIIFVADLESPASFYKKLQP